MLPLMLVCTVDESGIGGGSLGQLAALLSSKEELASLNQYKCPAVIMSQHVLAFGKTPHSSRGLEWLTDSPRRSVCMYMSTYML